MTFLSMVAIVIESEIGRCPEKLCGVVLNFSKLTLHAVEALSLLNILSPSCYLKLRKDALKSPKDERSSIVFPP